MKKSTMEEALSIINQFIELRDIGFHTDLAQPVFEKAAKFVQKHQVKKNQMLSETPTMECRNLYRLGQQETFAKTKYDAKRRFRGADLNKIKFIKRLSPAQVLEYKESMPDEIPS